MCADARIPAYLGRVLDADGDAVGTCFQISERTLVTAWHVLDSIGLGEVGSTVQVDSLAGGLPAAASRVQRVDQVHDLALLVREEPLPKSVLGIVGTDKLPMLTAVTITGVCKVSDPDHQYDWMDATGTWQGGTIRDSRVPLGRLEATAVLPGMSGAPVRLLEDDKVVGIVSARYNSADGWLRNSVLVARTEHLEDLLDGIVSVEVMPWTARQDQQNLHTILQDLEAALGRLSQRELDRVAADQDVLPADFGSLDVGQMISIARSRRRLLQLIDACVAANNVLSPEEEESLITSDGEVASPTVVFHSSGERFTVTLPLDLTVSDAAKKIVADYFLRELPPKRRTAYLFHTDFFLVNNGQILYRGSLRDAGVNDSSQLTVITAVQYPFAHDADMVVGYFESDTVRMADAAYRLMSYIRSTLRVRLNEHGLDISGTAGGSNVGGISIEDFG